MAQINYQNLGDLQRNQQIPNIQFPYNNNLIMNTPYDNYMGRQMQQNLSIQYLKCRPVSSKEEARASQIELDGSLNVFTDIANGKIYTKQINNDGTATFKTYVFTEDENPYNSSEFVTKDQFNKVIQTLMASMNLTNNNIENNDNSKNNNNNLTF